MQTIGTERSSDETRSKLIDAARAVFAQFGYTASTTRQICLQARANAAAVNYHFGDKLGLYTEVLKSIICSEDARAIEEDLLLLKPEQALRRFIVLMFENLSNLDGSDAYARIMSHELSQPTPALAVVVEQMIRPRALVLCAIVARITGHSQRSQVTRLCAHSIIAQIVHHIHARPVIKLLWPEWQHVGKMVDVMVEHTTEFSLAALQKFAQRNAESSSRKRSRPSGTRVKAVRRSTRGI